MARLESRVLWGSAGLGEGIPSLREAPSFSLFSVPVTVGLVGDTAAVLVGNPGPFLCRGEAVLQERPAQGHPCAGTRGFLVWTQVYNLLSPVQVFWF